MPGRVTRPALRTPRAGSEGTARESRKFQRCALEFNQIKRLNSHAPSSALYCLI